MNSFNQQVAGESFLSLRSFSPNNEFVSKYGFSLTHILSLRALKVSSWNSPIKRAIITVGNSVLHCELT